MLGRIVAYADLYWRKITLVKLIMVGGGAA